ncbi:MAG: tetratricopeptide repeat protein [Bacteroidales bacterium]|nr:tetratricopeptide repeat protein [Bacteroidales bacterium]
MKKTLAAILFFLSLCVSMRAQYDRDVFYIRGRTALQDGKYALAIENFNILASLDTTDYWNFFFRGIAKYNLGDIRGSQQDFDRSVRINPVFTNGYHYRAITKSRQGQYDEALEDLETAIKLRPGFSGLYYSRGVTYFLARRFDGAVKDFDYYIRKEPKDPGAYLNRGASQLFLGDTTKALEDYNKAISLDRFEPEGYMRRSRLYAAQGKYEDALADMNRSIGLDSTNTLAYFNRALLYYDTKDYNAAMADLDRVLRDEPGNALTLYNRSLISAQVGDYESALYDMDRVININPGNVLAYFNRASYFIEMNRWQDALADYNKAIELYPDFAKAYMNRAYVENMLGLTRASKADYETARKKVAEYRIKNASGEASFADTTRKYSALLALDADFARKDFDNELLQHRDVDIRLKPLYKFRLAQEQENAGTALSRRFDNPLIDRFGRAVPVPVVISNSDTLKNLMLTTRSLGSILAGDSSSGAGRTGLSPSEISFLKGVYDVQNKQYSSALQKFDDAVNQASNESSRAGYERFYKAFYLMNRGVLRAEMIDFIASIESNVQTLTMDDQGATRARVSDRVDRSYDYSEAIADMQDAIAILPDIPYLYFNLGNLRCLSGQMVEAIENYDSAIRIYPHMGDAYYNRGLVLIYLKDKEKGCIDLSRAGELGVADAYSVISKYCEDDVQQ